jgi:hypothetical protein
VIEKFGPAGTDNFYRAQNRMIAADSGGDTLVPDRHAASAADLSGDEPS